VLLSFYLLVTKLLNTNPYCLWGSGCSIVQSSRFGAVFGLPVSAFGLVFYGALLWWGLQPMVTAARWALVFPAASAGLAASVVFTAVQQTAIRAACTLCLLSAALSAAIFALALSRRPQPARPGTWLLGGAAALAVVVFLAAGYAASAPRTESETYAEGLAKHLAATGARFYGAFWCPHCKDQKAVFGRAARFLPYIECDAQTGQPQTCTAAGVRAFPTWDIAGKRYEGFLPLEELARLTGYPPPPGSQ
jgi:uncharacterized membrane protein